MQKLLLFLFIFFLLKLSASYLSSGRIGVVEVNKKSGNILMRGDIPFDRKEGLFKIEKLQSAIAKAMKEYSFYTHTKLPSIYSAKLIIFSVCKKKMCILFMIFSMFPLQLQHSILYNLYITMKNMHFISDLFIVILSH